MVKLYMKTKEATHQYPGVFIKKSNRISLVKFYQLN